MRPTLLAVAVASTVSLAWSVPGADADRVRTKGSTKCMKQPGEQDTVLTRVGPGRFLSTIGEDGRWYKVRIDGRTCWITRSSVVSLAAREMPRNTRRRPFVDGRSTRRGFSGEAPDDRVGADAAESRDESVAAEGEGRGRKGWSSRDDREMRRDQDSRDQDGRRRDQDSRRRDDRDQDDGRDDQASATDDRSERDDGEVVAEASGPRMVTVRRREADLFEKPSSRGKIAFSARKGERLAVVDENDSGNWYKVEDQDGEQAWIAADDVAAASGSRGKQVSVAARLGFAMFSQSFVSNGTQAGVDTLPPNYKVGSAAMAISVGADYVRPYGQSYLLGIEGRYTGAKAAPGIRFAMEDIAFSNHDFDARLIAGYDFHRNDGLTAWARLGYHYNAFKVANLENAAKLASENLSGYTVGAAVELPRLSGKLGGRATIDYLLSGKRSQTEGLEDGATSTAKAYLAGAVLTYQWRAKLLFDAGYQLTYAKTAWSGASPTSERGLGNTTASRTDLVHTVTVGLMKPF